MAKRAPATLSDQMQAWAAPWVAPGLASVLAEREMPVQRAVVLGAFGVATVALFTCSALVGGA